MRYEGPEVEIIGLEDNAIPITMVSGQIGEGDPFEDRDPSGLTPDD